jgi:carboxyl-terminal processing protease
MRRQYRHLLLLSAGTLLGVAVSTASGVLAQKEPPAEALPYEKARLLAEVLQRVRTEYVEPVSDEALLEAAVRGMVTELDPHSQFLDCDEYAEVRIATSGNYSGVGVEVQMDAGEVRVVAAIDGTPAARAGLRTGDIIVAIDATELDASNYREAVALMRGKVGTPVTVTVRRADEAEPVPLQLIRNHVEVKSVSHAVLEDGYGYIRISHFSATTWKDTRKALRQLQRSMEGELRGLLLDLRNNPGGVLDAAVAMADGFLDAGVIVTASGRGPDATFSHQARPGDLLEGAQLMVLVNQGSASSSEIVAGALQDNGRALVVGTRSFGKGSVQTVMPLADCEAVKLTTSRYFTPSGASIQDSGIQPDIEILADPRLDALSSITASYSDPGQSLLQGDSQLRQAFELLQRGGPLQSRAD